MELNRHQPWLLTIDLLLTLLAIPATPLTMNRVVNWYVQDANASLKPGMNRNGRITVRVVQTTKAPYAQRGDEASKEMESDESCS